MLMEKIDKEKWYGVNEIIKLNVMPVAYRVGIIERIKAGKLRAVNTGKVKPRYRIKGEWLIEYLVSLEDNN